MRIDHIGIAVQNLQEAIQHFQKILGQPPDEIERVEQEGVEVAFFTTDNGPDIELLAPLSPHSPIARFIEKRGEGIHHIAFASNDLNQEIQRLRPHFEVLYDPPRPGARNKQVTFLHPRQTHGVLIEFCQKISPTLS